MDQNLLNRKKLSQTPGGLDRFGLPSRGELRLKDFSVQEEYFNCILERLSRVNSCLNSQINHVQAELKDLSIVDTHELDISITRNHTVIHDDNELYSTQYRNNSEIRRTINYISAKHEESSCEMDNIFLALRKLREALTSTSRFDLFAWNVYTFSARIAILYGIYESYLPALNRIIEFNHNTCSHHPKYHREKIAEFIAYLALDKACRQKNLLGALEMTQMLPHSFFFQKPTQQGILPTYNYPHNLTLTDIHSENSSSDKIHLNLLNFIKNIIIALIRNDWVLFWRCWDIGTIHHRALMIWAINDIRSHTVKCLARSYYNVERVYLEKCVQCKWDTLSEFQVAWKLNVQDNGNEIIVIRNMKRKSVRK